MLYFLYVCQSVSQSLISLPIGHFWGSTSETSGLVHVTYALRTPKTIFLEENTFATCYGTYLKLKKGHLIESKVCLCVKKMVTEMIQNAEPFCNSFEFCECNVKCSLIFYGTKLGPS